VLPRKKTRTQTNQGQHMAWWTQTLGARPVTELTPALLATCHDQLARDRSAGTVNQYLRTLSHALSVAVREWGWLESNPLRHVPYLPEPHGRVRFLDEAERPRLLAACQSSANRMLYPVVALALATGARKIELLSLTWLQLALGRALVTLHHTKNGTPRSILVTGQALDVMRAHARVIRLDTPLVFPRAEAYA
jgi:integrase